MAQKIILPSQIVGHFLPRTPCPGCGEAGQLFQLRYPSITYHHFDVEIVYPGQCSCGAPARVRIQWPILLFGYLLARLQVTEAHSKWTRSKASMTVSAADSRLLGEVLADFSDVMGVPGSGLTRPSEADRLVFDFDEGDWTQFLRRLGYGGEGESAERG